MSRIVLDCETFSLDDAAQFIEEPTAPSNYKDPEKIAAYIKDATAKAIDRCALDPDLCRVVAVGVWEEDAIDPTVFTSEHHFSTSEHYMLQWLLDAIAGADLVGFNILGFDLPVLIRRSQYLGLKVPASVLNLDRYRTPHIDLMERLSFNGKLKYRSLDFYCKRFGIDVPDVTTGKDVDAMVKAGDWVGVANHCRADLLKTRALAKRVGYLQPVTVQDLNGEVVL